MTVFERKSLTNSKHRGTEASAVQTLKALNSAFHLKDILSPLGIIIANPLLRATKPDLNGKPAASPAETAAAASKTAFLWKSVNNLTFNNLFEIRFPWHHLSWFMSNHGLICSYYVISAKRCFPLGGASFQILAG